MILLETGGIGFCGFIKRNPNSTCASICKWISFRGGGMFLEVAQCGPKFMQCE